jgi:predicted flavoprotein YhiN
VHALHTVHAVPDVRIAAGRLRDVFYCAQLFATTDLRVTFWARSKPLFEIQNKTLSRFLWAGKNTINLTHERFRNELHKSVPRKIKTATLK